MASASAYPIHDDDVRSIPDRDTVLLTVDAQHMIVHGGVDGWTSDVTLPEWYDMHVSSMCVSGVGCVMVTAGCDESSRQCVMYDVRRHTLTDMPDLQQGRSDHESVLHDGSVFVCGGWDDDNEGTNTVEYLPLSAPHSWKSAAHMPHAVVYPILASHTDHIYALGGINDDVEQSHVQQYTPSQDTWIHLSDMPRSCTSNQGGAVVHNDQIHVVQRDYYMSYTPLTKTWTLTEHTHLGYCISPPVMYAGFITVLVKKDGEYTLLHLDLTRRDDGWMPHPAQLPAPPNMDIFYAPMLMSVHM